jgi:hypothetical protein
MSLRFQENACWTTGKRRHKVANHEGVIRHFCRSITMLGPVPMPRYLLICIAALALQGCSHLKPAASARVNSTHAFRGSFGESFGYRDPLTIAYNPHGGADRALFSYDGTPVGAMFVTALPPSKPDDTLVDVIIRATKKNYGATSVTHQQVTNTAGHVLHRFSSDAHHDGTSYQYLLCLYFEERQFTNTGQSLLSKNFGTYKFEFVIPDAIHKDVLPHLDFVIDSFKPPADRGQ